MSTPPSTTVHPSPSRFPSSSVSPPLTTSSLDPSLSIAINTIEDLQNHVTNANSIVEELNRRNKVLDSKLRKVKRRYREKERIIVDREEEGRRTIELLEGELREREEEGRRRRRGGDGKVRGKGQEEERSDNCVATTAKRGHS